MALAISESWRRYMPFACVQISMMFASSSSGLCSKRMPDHMSSTVASLRNHLAVFRSMMTEAGFVLGGEGDFLRNPEDDHQMNVFNPEIRGNTDRIVYRFRKPE